MSEEPRYTPQEFIEIIKRELDKLPKPLLLEDFSEWIACKTDQAFEQEKLNLGNHYASIQHAIDQFEKERSK